MRSIPFLYPIIAFSGLTLALPAKLSATGLPGPAPVAEHTAFRQAPMSTIGEGKKPVITNKSQQKTEYSDKLKTIFKVSCINNDIHINTGEAHSFVHCY